MLDIVILVTPEYNSSFPAPLKNVLGGLVELTALLRPAQSIAS